MNPYLSNRIDVARLLTRFGGVPELCRRLNANSVAISIKTVEKWRERQSIPSPRLIQLVELASREGQPIALDDYIIRN
jgi:hypothetical protein